MFICTLCKKIRSKWAILKKFATRTPVSTKRTNRVASKNHTSGRDKIIFLSDLISMGLMGKHTEKSDQNSKKIFSVLAGLRRKRQKTRIPYGGGGGAARWLPKPCPLPQLAEFSPKSAELPTTWLGLRETPSVRQWSAKCPPSARQGVTWPVWCGVRKRNFFKYSVQKPSSTLLQCQSLPTSSLRAVRSEYLAYIVVAFIYKQGGRLFFLSRRRYILQATSLQRTVNNKNKACHNSTCGTVSSLFFSRWKVLLHTVYISNILCGLRLRFKTFITKEAFCTKFVDLLV